MSNVNDEMVSLFDYLGRPAGSDLGKAVYTAAKASKVPVAERHVSTKNYTGKILMYPKSFLDKYFKVIKTVSNVDELPF